MGVYKSCKLFELIMAYVGLNYVTDFFFLKNALFIPIKNEFERKKKSLAEG